MVIVAIIVGAGVIMEICSVIGAPLGYQDEAGFHKCDKSTATDQDSLFSNPS